MDKIKNLEKLAWEQLSANNLDKSLEYFNEIFKKEPKNLAAIQGRIACYRKKKNFTTSSSLLQTAIPLYPNEPGILSENAWNYLEQNEYDLAIQAFKIVLAIKKDDPGLFLWQLYLMRRQARYAEAMSVIREAKSLFPRNRNILIEEGWIFFYLMRYEESIELFKQVLKEDPVNELAIQGEIACYRSRGEYDKAIQQANNSLAAVGKSPGIYSEMGWINMGLGNYDLAATDFKHVLALINDDPYAHINLAWALLRQNSDEHLDEALNQCKYALNISPELSEALGCIGNILFRKGKMREAETYFKRSIKADPLRGAFADLGALYIKMERYDDAKIQLDQALVNNPGDAYAHLEMGYLYLNTDKLKHAIREFK